jgi:hypothetical protein
MPPNFFVGTFPLGGNIFGCWITGRQGLLLLPWTTPSPTHNPTHSPTHSPTLSPVAGRILVDQLEEVVDCEVKGCNPPPARTTFLSPEGAMAKAEEILKNYSDLPELVEVEEKKNLKG